MAIRTLEYLKTRFENKDTPTQSDFTDLIDSCYNGLTALSGSGDTPNLLLSYITNFNYFDSVLATLTANSLIGTSQSNPLYTSTNLSLTADQININLNDLELLISRSNTLLNTLTAVDYATSSRQNVTNTLASGLTSNTLRSNNLLNTLTAVDYATSSRQNVTNTLLNALTSNTVRSNNLLNTLTAADYATGSRQNITNNLLNGLTGQTNSQIETIFSSICGTNTRIETVIEYVDNVETRLLNIQNNTQYFTPNSQLTRTVQLSSGLYCANIYIWSIQGTSFAPYDQYLQIRGANDNSLLFTQKIKANENFEFNFWPNGPGTIIGQGFDTIVCNSLTPFSHTRGNNDLYLYIRGKSAIVTPGGPG